MRPRWEFGVLLGAASCISEQPIKLPVYDGYRSVIIMVESGGARAAAAGSLEGPLALPLAIDRSMDNQIFVLYYPEPLLELGFREGPLELSKKEGCGTRLPRPAQAFSATTIDRELTPWVQVPPAATPEPRVAFEGGACPVLVPEAGLLVDVRCGELSCSARMDQTQCGLQINTAECDLGVVDGVVHLHGEVCFDHSEKLGRCQVVAPVDGARLSVECTGGNATDECRIDAHDFVTTPLFDVEPVVIGGVDGLFQPEGFERPPGGYLSDVVVLADRVVVVALVDPQLWFPCEEESPSSRLVIIDPDSMQIRSSTIAMPPCLTQLVRDPFGDGFFGVHGHPPRATRFDREGTRIGAEVTFEHSDLTEFHFASSVMIAGSPPDARLVATITSVEPEIHPPLRSLLFLVDLGTFTQVATPLALGRKTRELAPYMGDELLAVDDAANGPVFVNYRNGGLRSGVSLVGAQRGTTDLGQPLYLASSKLLLVSTTGIGGSITTIEDDEGIERTHLYENVGHPWAIHIWPNDPRLVLVSVTTLREARTSGIVLFDPTALRFLPGLQMLGPLKGPMGRLRADPRGRLWTALAWVNEVVRISPH